MYKETAWLHSMMRDADERIRKEGLIKGVGKQEWFALYGYGGMIEDDHVPVRLKAIERTFWAWAARD